MRRTAVDTGRIHEVLLFLCQAQQSPARSIIAFLHKRLQVEQRFELRRFQSLPIQKQAAARLKLGLPGRIGVEALLKLLHGVGENDSAIVMVTRIQGKSQLR